MAEQIEQLSDRREEALIAFSLGPVQTFIAAARTLRDLWTGSYILSYLVFRAMEPVLKASGPEALIFPSIAGHVLYRKFQSRETDKFQSREKDVEIDELLTPSLPNIFLAKVEESKGPKLASACREACQEAWTSIAGAVRDKLTQALEKDKLTQALEKNDNRSQWKRYLEDARWDEQIGSFFEIRAAVLPLRDCSDDLLKNLLAQPSEAAVEDQDRFGRARELAGRLVETQRMVRHVPRYAASGEVPQKCSLLGSYEQMGPADREASRDSRDFWNVMQQVSIGGTRIRPQERLCAVSLVKRFAWPAFFATELTEEEIDPRKRRFADTATVAASVWLSDKRGGEITWTDIETEGKDGEKERWNGQWLHWRTRDQGTDQGDDPVPDDLWKQIKRRRKPPPEGCGEPPTYYAVVTMDGDRMGEKLRVANEDEQRQISRWLSTFATKKVTRIVKDHRGELIYSGGDDVLAMLPVSTAIAAAGELAKTFRSGWPIKKQSATVSAGIAVVHYKEDLRFALDAARRAEVHAKESGRDALTLAICRRSGEHTSVLVPWSVAEKSVTEKVDELVKHFIGGLSDRWTYALRTEVGSLPNYDAFEAELRRLLRRTEVILSGDKTDEDQEKAKERKEKAITDCCELLSLYRDAMKARTPNAEDRDRHICQWFTVLCQSASFLARGRDR